MVHKTINSPSTGASTHTLNNMTVNKLSVLRGHGIGRTKSSPSTSSYVDTDKFANLKDVTASNNNIGIGEGALEGITSTTTNAIALGQNVGADVYTGLKSISLGSAFGAPYDQSTSQNGIGSWSIAIGSSTNGNAGSDLGNFSVMIGGATCYNGCGNDVVSIGKACGSDRPPGANSILIGTDAGQGSSSAVGQSCICIGYRAGASSAGTNSILIGTEAGETGAGTNSILIGNAAKGVNGSTITDNSIVINATGQNTQSVEDGLVIKPIFDGNTQGSYVSIYPPNDQGFTHYLAYNPSTGEIRSYDTFIIPPP